MVGNLYSTFFLNPELLSETSSEMQRVDPQLSGDIVETIVSHVEIPHDSPHFSLLEDWKNRPYCFLATLCLVSKLWLTPARRQLYRVIPPFDIPGHDYSSFFTTVQKYEGVRSHIRRLHINLRTSEHGHSLRDELMLKCIPSFPRCSVIANTSDDDIPLVEELMTLDSLAVLYISAVRCHSPRKDWETTFQRWPSLQRLRINQNPKEFPQWAPANILSAESIQLPSLRVLMLSAMDKKWAFPPTTSNTLHTLILRECVKVAVSTLVAFIRHHSTSLRRIFIEDLELREDETALDDIGFYAPNLEFLYIHKTWHITEAIFSNLPASLVEVSLGLERDIIQPAPCLEFIRRCELGSMSLTSLAIEILDASGIWGGTPLSADDLIPMRGQSSRKLGPWERKWLQVQAEAESLGIRFTWTLARALFADIRPLGCAGPLQPPPGEFGQGPARKDDPVWSRM
jgi:hypothetical protein